MKIGDKVKIEGGVHRYKDTKGLKATIINIKYSHKGEYTHIYVQFTNGREDAFFKKKYCFNR